MVFPKSSPDTYIPPEKQDELIRNAVEICWKMLMLSCPMFVCQPEAIKGILHEYYENSYDGPGELVYYQPVLMRCAGSDCVVRGLVDKKLSTGIKIMSM